MTWIHRPTVDLCAPFLIYILGNTYMTSLAPKGDCDDCCTYDITRDVTLYAYTRANLEKGIPLSWEGNNMNNGILREGLPTAVYIHGWTEQYLSESAVQIKNGFLYWGYQVVIVDWSRLATLPWYKQSVVNAGPVGEALAGWLDLQIKFGLPLDTLHLVGFSLGVEVAGYAGANLKAGTLPRITGLDPPHDRLTMKGIGRRLSSTDAAFVDVIHSDLGPTRRIIPDGHADFYPNMGLAPQPGCSVKELLFRQNEIIICSHQRAWRYFVESMYNLYGFPAIPLIKGPQLNYVYMGLSAHPSTRGLFYLETNAKPPYALGRPLKNY